MYSTCVYCQGALGANRVVEAFPVGRKLAFDAQRGRLWVVCTHCARWNLTPLEERWEAIETCERLYRETKIRASTDQIGLAKLREGLELVRVGAPSRPEFAAWRYGREFARRKWKSTAMITGLGVYAVGIGAMSLGHMMGLVAAVPAGGLLVQLPQLLNLYNMRRTVAQVAKDDGSLLRVRRAKLDLLRFERGPAEFGGWQIRVNSPEVSQPLTGAAAERVLSRVMSTINGGGADKQTVASALSVLEAAGTRDGVFDAVLKSLERRKLSSWDAPKPEERLALEMALHEHTERAAMEGDLQSLEAAWREAEEIAAIADNLLVPAWIRQRIRSASADD